MRFLGWRERVAGRNVRVIDREVNNDINQKGRDGVVAAVMI